MYNSPYFLINSPSPTELGKWDGGIGGKEYTTETLAMSMLRGAFF